MKKIFTIAAAILASVTMMAETETHPSSASSNEAITGISYSLDGNYVAGVGGTKAGDMQSKGIKFRLNRTAGDYSNAVEFAVNEGYVISEIAFCGHVNDNSKTSTLNQVIVDGADINFTPVSLPSKTSSASFSIDGIAATESIILVFEGEGTQANLEYAITYSLGEPSTDPVLNVNKEEVTLAVTASNPSAEEVVKFSGKNLAPGNYSLTIPNQAGLTVTPADVNVGEDGKLNAEITINFSSVEDVAAGSTSLTLTIGDLSKSVVINFSASMAVQYISNSFNIEQLIVENGKGYDIRSAFSAANIEFNDIDALDSLNNSKGNARNEAYLGLKIKKQGGYVACWLQVGQTIRVKFGYVGAAVNAYVAGESMSLTPSDNALDVLEYTAPADSYVKIETTSDKTVVLKQIMVDAAIADVMYKINYAETENGSVSGWTVAFPGEEVELHFAAESGYIVMNCTVNGVEIHQSEPFAPITFIMPAEAATVNAEFSLPTGIENAEESVKAVKFFEGGQMMILKNGVKYNAQGNLVK